MNIKDKFNKKKITIDEIKKIYKIDSYSDLYDLVTKLIENNEIEAIKSSGGNGKKPALYERYRVIEEVEDNSFYLSELNYKISIKFDVSYYKKNINKYKEHRKYILLLDLFIKEKENLLEIPVSMNERSFQIWGREKFLQKEEGKAILKNLGLQTECLNYYDTSEPLAYYSKFKKSPQNILILENKDTYYTMRKYLINSKNKIFGRVIDTVIYGAGKGIIKAFKDYEVSVEDYLSNRENKIFYFGDLDYEGILIYESFYFAYKDQYDIKPFIEGYKKMIDKVGNISSLPKIKEGQNRKINEYFLQEFSLEYREKIKEILNNDLYIPQEIINIIDLQMEEK
ncbi:Wadjet anti-phage system protein JetD domain-containing protein [Clostridium sp. ATCC 25772]|uniref:Wadjet anti-phage system protein JetD domain-containing protein n=1 Tax=Clostridium sp. ATCC 25772 TaxID=1676991 RepID=UPI0007862000|nr:Wadjet anti-phage system protein JetD domain-containing protein [Clostridium sp. ATCC 25772]